MRYFGIVLVFLFGCSTEGELRKDFQSGELRIVRSEYPSCQNVTLSARKERTAAPYAKVCEVR